MLILFHRELAGINTFKVVGAKDTVEKEVMCECLHGHMFSHKIFFFNCYSIYQSYQLTIEMTEVWLRKVGRSSMSFSLLVLNE